MHLNLNIQDGTRKRKSCCVPGHVYCVVTVDRTIIKLVAVISTLNFDIFTALQQAAVLDEGSVVVPGVAVSGVG